MESERRSVAIEIASKTAFFIPYAALAGFSLSWLITITSHRFGDDFAVYVRALGDTLAGVDPYAPYSVGTGFLNHPFVLVLVRIFYFPDHRFRSTLLWASMGVAAWIASVLLCKSMLNGVSDQDERRKPVIGQDVGLLIAFLFFAPFVETVALGQVNPFALVTILGSFYLSERGRDWLAGLGLGLAIVLKTSPILVLVYFLLVRKRKVFVSGLLSLTLLTAATALLFSSEVLNGFLVTLGRLSSEIHPSGYNGSFLAISFRLLSDAGIRNLEVLLPATNKGLLSLLLMSVVYLVWKFPITTQKQRIWLFALVLVLMVNFSPLLWYHHIAFLLLPYSLMLFASPPAYRVLGLLSLSLVQLERYFEFAVFDFPWPVVGANLILLTTVLIGFIGIQRRVKLRPIQHQASI